MSPRPFCFPVFGSKWVTMMAAFVSRLEYWTGAILLCSIVFLVFIAAVMRFTGYPLIWSVDLAQLLFIWLCFIGASKALRARAHLGVDLLVQLFSPRHRLYLEFVQALLCLVFLAILAVKGTELTILNKERIFGDSGMPYAFVTIAVPVGCVMLTISILANLVDAWRGQHAAHPDLVFSKANDPVDAKVTEAL